MALNKGGSGKGKGGFLAWANPAYTAGVAEPIPTGMQAQRKLMRSVESTGGVLQQIPHDLGQRLPPLPETLKEAQAVAQALGASPTADVIHGEQATRSSVISRSASGDLAKRNVLMFATHGLVPDELAGLRQPALAMAHESSDPRDMLLTLEDVAGLRLNADWVILSACSTASADKAGGDPLSGLARGFFYAGAKGLLVTQWAVDSDSAKEITTRTVANFAKMPHQGHASALRRAMLDLIEAKDTAVNWSHPAFWSPFVFVGGH